VPTIQVGLPVFMVMVRIREEQEVLQKEFGNEWEDYHRATNRFLPGILSLRKRSTSLEDIESYGKQITSGYS
jgi:hypothetical protein